MKLTGGLDLETEIAARRETKNSQNLSIIGPVFRRHVQAKLAALPCDGVQDVIKQTKTGCERFSENQFTLSLEEPLGAEVANKGEINADVAVRILAAGLRWRKKPRFDEQIISAEFTIAKEYSATMNLAIEQDSIHVNRSYDVDRNRHARKRVDLGLHRFLAARSALFDL
jgi:hypothetical protein